MSEEVGVRARAKEGEQGEACRDNHPLGLAGSSVPTYRPPPLPQSKKSTWTRYDAAGTTGALK